MRPLTVAVVFGTRPDAVKMAPVVHALAADPRFECITIATAQHREMLDEVHRRCSACTPNTISRS